MDTYEVSHREGCVHFAVCAGYKSRNEITTQMLKAWLIKK
jgi:hypothetical protein